MNPDRALKRLLLQPVDRIPHWEHFSNPDFFSLISGVDAYQHPRQAAQRVAELLPLDMGVGIPATDDPIPALPDESSWVGEDGRRRVRWGSGASGHWAWGEEFKSIEQALAYSPLAVPDQRDKQVICNMDFSQSVEDFARGIQGLSLIHI